MIGFQGQRQVVDLKDGRIRQRITMRTPDDRAFWHRIFPDGQVYRAAFFGARGKGDFNKMLPNVNVDHYFIFQTDEELKEWRHTFLEDPGFEHVVEWIGESMLDLYSRQRTVDASTPPASDTPPPVDPIEQLRGLSDKGIRSVAAEIGLPNIDENEGREMLLARVKRFATANPEVGRNLANRVEKRLKREQREPVNA